MNLYLLVRQTHILSMLVSLVLAVGAEFLLISIVRLVQDAHVEQRYRLAEHVLKVSDLTRFLGFLAGIALIIIGGWNPFAPWLVAAVGLFILMDVVGRVGMRPWQRQLQEMLADAGGTGVADLRGVVTESRAMVARWSIIALLLVIMVLMRQKPSFGL
jgi:uncharacterized membrane protein